MLRIWVFLSLVTAIAFSLPATAQQATCSDAIKKMKESPEMRMNGGAAQMQNGRVNALVYLQLAEQAAAQGDEKSCWVHVNRAHVVLIP